MKKDVTIKEVAQRAGVSIATVSRAMNDSGPVSSEARQAILKVVSSSGFRLNGIGRQLKTARSHTIGVLVPSLKNPIFADAVTGIEHAAEQSGYRVLLASSRYDTNKEVSAVETFLINRVDGLILTVADEKNSQALQLLGTTKSPFVLMFNPCNQTGYSSVSIDNRLAAFELVSALINRGHRRIAMIVGKLSDSDRSVERSAGYEEALRKNGIKPVGVIEVGFENPDPGTQIAELNRGLRSPTAYFCSTDMLAISTIRALVQSGKKIPDDVSVVGFDGITIGECLIPSLATAVQPAEEMGVWAARHLVARIDKGESVSNLVLPYRIRQGESWGRLTANHL
ncbi:MAG: substrate-binding domain-containing protein [Granulosicoccus sp.]